MQILLTWTWHWLPPLMLMAVIFYLSSLPTLPSAPGPWLDAFLKKLTHAAEYALLFVLLLRAWRHHLSADQALRAALVTTALYAVSDEWHQAFVPGRKANRYDVLIDISVPLLLWWLWRGRLRRGLLRRGDEYLAE